VEVFSGHFSTKCNSNPFFRGKGKVVLCFLTELHAMKAYWGVEV
jgi:hypothetical protein